MYKVCHIAISVKNMGVSIDFYRRFGFKVLKTWRAEDGSIEIAHIGLENMVIEIFCYKSGQDLPKFSKELTTDLPVIGVKHFAFGVEHIENTYNDLLSSGIITDEVKIVNGRLGKKYFFIKDPDGILIEIIEN